MRGWISFLVFLRLFWGVASITWPWEDDDGDDDDDRNPYQPYTTECPSENLLREADSLSEEEKAYVSSRHEKTNKNLVDFLKNVAQLNDFDASDFIDGYSHLHNISIGLAFSGGGYRAMLSGAGNILALDGRYEASNKRALGGILQSSTYISGLSGGSWLLGSLIFNDWASVGDIIDGDVDIWNLEDSIFNPNGINIYKTGKYYTNIGTGIYAKNKEFETSLTDIWGRSLSYQFMGNKGGENVTWSSIVDIPSFQDHEMPYPIVLADGRYNGTYIVNLNSSIFEFSPYEFGSWDPSINSFIPTKYIGTYLDNGKPNSSDSCVVNFDNAGYVMGTSSTLFNVFLTRLDEFDANKYLKSIVNKLLGMVDRSENDIAIYEPNPFYNSEYAESENLADSDVLHLVDGSEDEQNIPLYPLIQSRRQLDVMFAFDNSGDTSTEWPNASSIVHTFRRQFSHQGKGSPVPFVPSTKEFIEEGLDTQPTFFGCNSSKLTPLVDISDNKDINATDIPIMIYFPNSMQSFDANTSWHKLSYDDDEKLAMIKNGFEVSSRSNYSDDRQWPTCVGCALIRRTQERFGIEQSEECKRCFDQYCWEPTEDDASYEAVLSLSEAISSSSSKESTKTSLSGSHSTSAKASDDADDDDSDKSKDVTTSNSASLTLLIASLVFSTL